MKRNGNRRLHHFEQYAYAPGVIEPLECATKLATSLRIRTVTGPQAELEKCQCRLVCVLAERFHRPRRNGNRAIVAGKYRGNADSAPHR